MLEVIKVRLQLLPGGRMPKRMSDEAAGWDVYAAEPQIVKARSRAEVKLGIALAIEPGWYAKIAPRSGLAAHGIECFAGTIDSDYRGEVIAIVKNSSTEPYTITPEDRLLQLVFLPVPAVEWELVDELPPSARGTAGFGSTGR